MQNIFEELFIENENFKIDEEVQERFAESLEYLLNDCDKAVRSHAILLKKNRKIATGLIFSSNFFIFL